MQFTRIFYISFLFLFAVSLICGGGCKKKKNVFIPIPGNNAPAVDPIPDQTATFGVTFLLELAPYVTDDHDDVADLTFAVTSSLGSFTVSEFSGTFTTEGDVMVPFTVTDTDGAKTASLFKITVGAQPNNPPTIDPISDQVVIVSQPFNLDVATIGNVADDHDTVGDLIFRVTSGGGSFTGGLYSNTFQSLGNTTVNFEIEDLNGATTASQFKVTVNEVPNVAPTIDPIPDQQTVAGRLFQLNVVQLGNAADDRDAVEDLVFRVTSGGGSFSSGIYSNTFQSTGNETVDFEIEDLDGAITNSSFNVEVLEPPFAVFTADTTFGIDNLTVNFTDDSSGNPTEWAWDFDGDGAVDATTQNASHFYDSPGRYTVTLAVSKAGASSTMRRTDYILVIAGGANVWYVDGTNGDDALNTGQAWDNAFATIQYALDTASSGHYVLVADGSYSENYLDFIGKSIYLKSANGAETCTLDGGGGGSVLEFTSNEMPDSVVDGFMIAGGSEQYGGGIFCMASAPTIINCVFLFNDAQYGGAIACMDHSLAKIVDCWFFVNMAEYGGAIYCEFFGNPEIVNCIFINNEADYGGAVGCVDVCSPDIIDSVFEENYASDSGTGDAYGGAVYCEYFCFPTIRNTEFLANEAEYLGGAIFNVAFCEAVVEGSAFKYNIGYWAGGAVFMEVSSTMDISDTSIVNNVGLLAGGGILADGNCDLTIEDSEISRNIGQGGAGILVASGCSLTAKNCQFAFNNAFNGEGGALLLGDNCDARLFGCAVVNNNAENAAGILIDYYCNITGINCTIADNFANSFGGGLSVEGNSSGIFQNTIIWANTAGTAGYQIFLENSGDTLVLDFCDFADNVLDPDNIAGVLTGFSTADSITSDPLFKSPANYDYALRPSSPCIDAGNNTFTFMAGLLEDLLGNTRVFDGDGDGTPDVDMGAFEYQP